MTKESCSWHALSERFGRWAYGLHRGRRWIDPGVLERVFAKLPCDELKAQSEQVKLDRSVCVSVDSAIVKVPSGPAGSGMEGVARDRTPSGGLTTKLQA